MRFEYPTEKRGVKFTLRFAQSEHVRSEMARSNLNIVEVVCRNSGYPTVAQSEPAVFVETIEISLVFLG